MRRSWLGSWRTLVALALVCGLFAILDLAQGRISLGIAFALVTAGLLWRAWRQRGARDGS